MTTAADLLASGLGTLRRVGLLALAAGAVLALLLTTHPAASGGHGLEGGSALRLAAATAP